MQLLAAPNAPHTPCPILDPISPPPTPYFPRAQLPQKKVGFYFPFILFFSFVFRAGGRAAPANPVSGCLPVAHMLPRCRVGIWAQKKVRNPEFIEEVLGQGAESALNICLEKHPKVCGDEAKVRAAATSA